MAFITGRTILGQSKIRKFGIITLSYYRTTEKIFIQVGKQPKKKNQHQNKIFFAGENTESSRMFEVLKCFSTVKKSKSLSNSKSSLQMKVPREVESKNPLLATNAYIPIR